MAGFREFVTGEVLTAANVDDFLAKQAVQKYADAAARDAALGTAVGGGNALREGMVAWLDDEDDLLAYNGSAWASVSAGVVQVVTATDATNRTTTSTSFVTANIEVSITPSDASNLLLVIWSATKYVEQTTGSSSFRGMRVRVIEVGGSAVPGINDARTENRLIAGSSEPAWIYVNTAHFGVVAAASTSARTYRGEFLARTGNTANLQNDENVGVLTVIEIDGKKVT